MAPWLTIIAGGVIGFLLGGILGGFVGAVAGYVLSLLIGGLVFGVRGGFVPREAKREAARRLLESFNEQTDAAFPSLDEPAQLRAVEGAVESLFRRSMDDNPGDGQRALSRECIRRAGVALSEEAETPALAEFWATLVGVVEYTMYPKQ